MTRLFFLVCALATLAAPARAVPFVQLRLAGTTNGGVAVADEAAYVRLLPDAQTGFDPNDASKLFPFASTYALLAPVGERDGRPYRLSVNSLPDGSPGVLTAPVSVPVDFYTTHAGSFTVRWNGPNELPAGWNAYLRDYTTGAVVNLRQQTVYAFTSGALFNWAARFQFVLTPAGVVGQLDVADRAGWRLLSSPVDGVTAGTLAGINLVQGVPAGSGDAQPQYPAASPNLYTSYTGTGPLGGYVRAPDTGTPILPGEGFFWYFYDAAFTPPDPASSGGGTSASRDLRGFTLFGYGAAPSADVTRTFPRTPDDNVMAGNPFAASFSLAGLSATGGALASTVQAYDPVGPTYRVLFRSNPGTGAADRVAPWQGFFAEVQDVPEGQSPTLTYAFAATGGADATFYGRGAPDALAVHLTLAGTTGAGAVVRDEAAWVRLNDGAEAGRDPDDARKLTPPTDTYALVAPVGQDGGAAARQSVVSLPVASALVPVAFTATAGGVYELRWDGLELPDGWTAGLRDLVTGAVVDLAAAEAYAFTAEATGWTERFALALTSAAVAAEPAAGSAFALSSPVPNPASGVSRLRLQAARSGRVVATVVDALGRTVQAAFDGEVAAGAAVEIAVDASALAPGTYAVRVAGSGMGPGVAETRRLVVVR